MIAVTAPVPILVFALTAPVANSAGPTALEAISELPTAPAAIKDAVMDPVPISVFLKLHH